MSFEKLLEELDVMAKSVAEDQAGAKDDENIQAAANEGGENEPDGDEGAAAGAAAGGDGDGDEPMGKSFAFTLENGEVIEAMDGTELVKSLMEKVDGQATVMVKALGQTLDVVKAQGELIKSLQADVKKLSNEGRGRKTVLAVTEKVPAGQTMAKSEPQGMTNQEFFAKANSAFKSGQISGQELAVIDLTMRSGMAIDQGLVAKVVG